MTWTQNAATWCTRSTCSSTGATPRRGPLMPHGTGCLTASWGRPHDACVTHVTDYLAHDAWCCAGPTALPCLATPFGTCACKIPAVSMVLLKSRAHAAPLCCPPEQLATSMEGLR